MGIPAGTYEDAGNRDKGKKSPMVGIRDGGREGLRSQGKDGECG